MAITPGPWRVDVRQTKCECGKTDHGSIGYIKADGIRTHEIAVIYMHEAHEADARLIAAAPEMLSALQHIRATSGDPRIEAMCDSAILKAEGQ